ncbi:sensor histidine kinase [Aureimonas sp. SK2]|uniref:sensor histidine kinase n=1 Tax=Aureimonas sp. SK2 TaxID=3015992 RepID=UPI002443B3AF|nr:HWE histidine kinase domain-containing protein [Aureimonas sp. SK2]
MKREAAHNASPSSGEGAQVSAARRFTLPIRWHLVVFAALVLLPQIGLGLCLGWWYSKAEHERLEASAVAAAATVSDQLDRELEAMKAALRALATSPNATSENFPALRQQSQQLLAEHGAMLAVRDRDGRQVLNSLVPLGQPLPTAVDPVLAAADARVIDDGEAAVSDLFVGQVTSEFYTAVIVPLVVGDRTRYAMSMALKPTAIQDILIRTRLPDTWTSTVLDSRGRIVARSRNQERFLGQGASSEFLREIEGLRSGVVPKVTGLDGQPHFAAFDTLDNAGWRVVVGVPHAVLNAPFRILVLTIAGTALLALGISTILARLYSLRLEREVTSLQAMAAATGTGTAPERRPGHVRELEAIAAALRASDASLLERNRTRDLLLAELNHRVRNTLSVLLAVVNQTIRSGGDEALARKTTGRIMALSRAHDLLSHAEWSPVALSDLVRRTSEAEGLPIVFEGREIHLRAEAVAPMAQVLHELSVNQRRHGRNHADGAVLRTAVEPGGVRLTWRLPGAQGERPCLPGFGLRLVRMCVERQLFGRIERLDAAGLEALLPPAYLTGQGLPTAPFAARWQDDSRA